MLGYVLGQLAHRLTTRDTHPDPATAERARLRAEQWQTLLRGIESGQVEVGSRTPVRDVPAWASLEVLTGGFATGALLAAGPWQSHEQELLGELQLTSRAELNLHFLSAVGLEKLRAMLASGEYRLELPEEGAWLVLAWLEQRGHLDQAAQLLEALLPYSDRLRFYPIPDGVAGGGSDLRVHLESVAEVRQRLDDKPANLRILAQRETIQVWLPFYDQLLALVQETVCEGQPGRVFPAGWDERRQQLMERYRSLRQVHRLCSRRHRSRHHFGQLLAILENGSERWSSQELRRLGHILQCAERKRGRPDSPGHGEARHRQQLQAAAPTHQDQAKLLSQRLASQEQSGGLEEMETWSQPGLEGFPMPSSLLSKLERCLLATVEELVERRVIGSGEVLARVVPQMVSTLRAGEFRDGAGGRLYGAIYRAFRRRRSLLLLDLQSQVKLEELPWVAALQAFRSRGEGSRAVSRGALRRLCQTALESFPQAILPNKLIKEMRALASSAEVDLVLTDELAADIFAGRFAPHYGRAAQRAQQWLKGTLYQVYYSIQPGSFEDLGKLCGERAEVGGWGRGRTVSNGRIIEQQQVLTTHNLAELYWNADLRELLQPAKLARRCWLWVCQCLQRSRGDRRHILHDRKNAAYAWRQMVFFLAVAEAPDVSEFFEEAGSFLASQPLAFQTSFQATWQGLLAARRGEAPDQPFYGWAPME